MIGLKRFTDKTFTEKQTDDTFLCIESEDVQSKRANSFSRQER